MVNIIRARTLFPREQQARQLLADSLASLEKEKSIKGGLFVSVFWQEDLARNLPDMEIQSDQSTQFSSNCFLGPCIMNQANR